LKFPRKTNLVIVQARMSSTRLPGKVLELLGKVPLIEYQLRRIKEAKLVQEIVVATSDDDSDNPLVRHLELMNQPYVRGSLNDVLSRYIKVIDEYESDYFLRITGDCPLVMPEMLDSMILEFEKLGIDYLSNALEPTFPDGLDVEIVKTSALRRLNLLATSSTEREHVTLGIYTRPEEFTIKNYRHAKDLSSERWTVDYPADLDFVRNVVAFESTQKGLLTIAQVINFISEHPEFRNTSPSELRNEALRDWKFNDE